MPDSLLWIFSISLSIFYFVEGSDEIQPTLSRKETVTPPGGGAKFFSKESSLLPHLFIYSCISISIDSGIYFLSYNKILSSFILLLIIFQLLPPGALSGWPLCPFSMPQSGFDFFCLLVFCYFALAIPCLLALAGPLGSSCISGPRSRIRHFPKEL